jgi:hypothetical protein
MAETARAKGGARMRAYFVVFDEYENTGIAFVAQNSKEARKMAWKSGEWDGNYIDIKPVEIKGANVDSLPPGEVMATIDALKRKIYCTVDDKCPICGKVKDISFSEDYDAYMCAGCEEDIWQAEKHNKQEAQE